MATATITPERTLAGIPITKVQARSPFLNVLVYGDSGVGKTTLCGSADEVPSMRPVLVIDIEGGTESLKHSYPDVEQIRVRTWREMEAVYSELQRGDHGFSTVVLDSLTEIQKFDMYNIMADLIARRPDLDPDVPSMREWGKNLEHMRKFVRNFRDLPMNVLFTALLRTDKDQRTGAQTYQPALSGKLAGEIAAFVDIVTYYYVKRVGQGEEAEDRRFLLCKKTEQQIAKDRTGKLPLVLESPTMNLIHSIIHTQKEATK